MRPQFGVMSPWIQMVGDDLGLRRGGHVIMSVCHMTVPGGTTTSLVVVLEP